MTAPISASIQQSIAANKFYPPHINPSQSIDRHSIISARAGACEFSGQIIIVEAQAGQGKTTLVYQFLEQIETPYVWYQIGAEDSDPVVLLGAMNLAFSRKFDHFKSPQLEAILDNGQIGPMDLQGCANILLNDIDAALESDVFLVLDDLHLINEAQLTTQLLDYLIDTSPPNLHYILVSRHPLSLEARAIRKNPYVLYLDSDDLALTLGDIECLYSNVFGSEISRSEAEQILDITNGWIMGIILAASPLANTKKSVKPENVMTRKPDLFGKGLDSFMLNFFQDEILTQIPEVFHEAFIKLSFLDEINIDFAHQLVDIENLDTHLAKVADQNFFIYHLDDTGRMFRFHHLFQEFLQSKGRQLLDSDDISEIYRLAADYYLEHDLIERALKSLRLGEDYQRMELVLKEHGLRLISANRTVTILGILQTIPEESLLEYGWLSFFHALLTRDFHPQTTLPYFHACIEKFIENSEEIGELMALSQIIYFHFVISGRYREGSKLLGRTRVLFESIHKKLPREISIMVVRNLAAGFCFFDGKMDSARHYARRGCDMAERIGSNNFLAASRFILGYIGLLSGDGRRARMEIEKSYPLVSDPLVGMSNRLTLHVMQLCELSMYGRFQAFLYHKDLVLEGVDREVVRQTVAAPYLYVWSAIGLISTGKLDDAIDLIEQGMFISKTAASEHMTSQLLQWRGLINALRRNEQAAIDDIELSTEMRTRAGGPFFTGYHFAIKGAVLALLGRIGEARPCLEQALAIADEIPSPYIQACAMTYLAYIEIKQDDETALKERLQALLELMNESGYDFFWGWEPDIMLLLLGRAVKNRVEPEFARALARQRLLQSLDDQGVALPILEIKVLGTFSISLNGEVLFSLKDFSAHQRELFGLLISSPDFRISQDQVQFALWPDSPPDKAGKTFYTLISRLRKVLAEKIDDPTRYICVEKSYLQLTNSTVDAARFLELARQGLSLGKRELWWQAGNAFYSALSYWESFSPTDYFQGDQATDYFDEIYRVIRSVCLTWSSTLAKFNRVDEALALLEKTDKLLLSDEDRVVLQHTLYLKKKNPVKAQKVLDSYRQELLRLGYSREEADELVNSLLQS
jgi:ATP/maltotriose-dependent transcriptional regulator MalT/DNA-binding SARP family transcriptional activator